MPASKKTKSNAKKTTPPKKASSSGKTTLKKTGTKEPKKNISRAKTQKEKSKTVKTKAKSIVVDVIEDDVDNEEKNNLSDFLNPSLPVFENETLETTKVEDLEIDTEVSFELDETESKKFNKFENFSGLVSEDLDSQKTFFKELKEETKTSLNVRTKDPKNKDFKDGETQDLLDLFEDEEFSHKKNKKNNNSRPLNLYTNFVWKFLLIVVLLVVFVGYFSFSKLIIDIVPRNENLNESLLLKVSSNANGIRLLSDPRENVSGANKEILISLSRNFLASGEEFVGEDISGRVKIINNYSRSQALVATTRLWSPDGKEFRIKEAVNVPAGGEVWVDVYVEKPSRDLAINPTTFTIPGLWVGLQDMIYAKSEEAFIFEQKKEKYVRASDLAAAEQEISNTLLQKLLVEIEAEQKKLELETNKKFAYVYLQEGETIIEADAKAEDRKESFNLKAEANFRVIFFSKEESEKLAYGKLNLLVPSGKELMDFNPDNITYSLESFNADDNTATIKSTFSAKMMLKSEGEVVDKENLVNLNAEQISSYLSAQPEIKSFSLKFQPSFIKTAPRLVDRIKVNLVEDNN
ncbi:hypothetical protein JXK06_01130 [Patescibacteria group bacterium]|nr:hypothetical protein [Patescibacteria group bacterium]